MNEFLNENLVHFRNLKRDFTLRIDGSQANDDRLLNELAGMYAVSVVASYEGVVRSTLISYAAKFHSKYEHFIESEFGKMNARIKLSDLKMYSKKFDLSKGNRPVVTAVRLP